MNGSVIPAAAARTARGARPTTSTPARAIGVEVATDLSRRLLDAGAPGLHLYALNRSESVLRIVDGLGIRPSRLTTRPGHPGGAIGRALPSARRPWVSHPVSSVSGMAARGLQVADGAQWRPRQGAPAGADGDVRVRRVPPREPRLGGVLQAVLAAGAVRRRHRPAAGRGRRDLPGRRPLDGPGAAVVGGAGGHVAALLRGQAVRGGAGRRGHPGVVHRVHRAARGRVRRVRRQARAGRAHRRQRRQPRAASPTGRCRPTSSASCRTSWACCCGARSCGARPGAPAATARGGRSAARPTRCCATSPSGSSWRPRAGSTGRSPRAQREREGLPHAATTTADEFMEATLDVWELAPESATRVGHPAPVPGRAAPAVHRAVHVRGRRGARPVHGVGVRPRWPRCARAATSSATTPTPPTSRPPARGSPPSATGVLAGRRSPAPVGDKAVDRAAELLRRGGVHGRRRSPSARRAASTSRRSPPTPAGREWLVDVVGGFTIGAAGPAPHRRARAHAGAGGPAVGLRGRSGCSCWPPTCPGARTPGGRALAEARGRVFVDVLPVDLPMRRSAAVVERLRGLRRRGAAADGAVPPPLGSLIAG